MLSTRLPQRIRRLRTLHHMQQNVLAKKSGIALSVLNRLEQGDATNMQVSTLLKLVHIFQVTPDYLLGFDGDEEQSCRRIVGDNVDRTNSYTGYPPQKCVRCDALLIAGSRHTNPRCMLLMHERGKSSAAIAVQFDLTVRSVDFILSEEYRVRDDREDPRLKKIVSI